MPEWCAIIAVIEHLSAAEIATNTLRRRPVHDHLRRRPADRPPPALRAADQGVADALEAVLSDNTRRVYAAQWKLFDGWCGDVGLRSLPAEPRTVACYLAARAGDGASIATLRLATSAIAKAHEWAGHESPSRDQGVRASLKGCRRRLSKPQRQAGALTADVLAVIRLTAVQPRRRGCGIETPDQAAERGKFDVALEAVLSDAGLRRSEGSRASGCSAYLTGAAGATAPHLANSARPFRRSVARRAVLVAGRPGRQWGGIAGPTARG